MAAAPDPKGTSRQSGASWLAGASSDWRLRQVPPPVWAPQGPQAPRPTLFLTGDAHPPPLPVPLAGPPAKAPPGEAAPEPRFGQREPKAKALDGKQGQAILQAARLPADQGAL